VDPLVVHGFNPGGEQLVQGGQVGDLPGRAGCGQLDEELLAHGAEEPFDLPAPLGLAGLGVGQPDPEDGQRA